MLTAKLNGSMTTVDMSTALITTCIVRYCRSATQINTSICNLLNTPPEKFLLNYAIVIDKMDGSVCPIEMHSTFKDKINLPHIVHIQQGARVMFQVFKQLTF